MFLSSLNEHTYPCRQAGKLQAMLNPQTQLSPCGSAQDHGNTPSPTYSTCASQPCCSRMLQSSSTCPCPMAQPVSLWETAGELKHGQQPAQPELCPPEPSHQSLCRIHIFCHPLVLGQRHLQLLCRALQGHHSQRAADTSHITLKLLWRLSPRI